MSFYIKPSDVLIQYPKYFELLAGVDDGIGKILKKLTDLGILDNTLIIFTSDNGVMFGEHGLFEKRFAYDPSTRTPLFIRYPAWFQDSTIITNQMALNVDIAPTILEAAGINGNYSFDGLSLKKLADHAVTRTSMYYEYLYDPATVQLPFMRSVRTFTSKLTDYGCDQQTEEFFDLSSDGREDTNRIDDTSYEASIQDLKNQLSNFKIQFADTAVEHGLICHLKTTTSKEQSDFSIDEESLPMIEDNILLFPDPAGDQLTMAFVSLQKDQRATILITDVFGTVVQQESLTITEGENIHDLALKKVLSSGSYFFTIVTNNERITRPLMIEK